MSGVMPATGRMTDCIRTRGPLPARNSGSNDIRGPISRFQGSRGIRASLILRKPMMTADGRSRLNCRHFVAALRVPELRQVPGSQR